MTMTVSLRKTEDDDYRYFETWWNDRIIADGLRATVEDYPASRIDEAFHRLSDEDTSESFGRTIIDPSGLPVGHIAGFGCKDPERNATLVVLIGPYFQDRGYGSCAMRLGIRLADSQLRASTITANVWAFNLRARHMCESLGFVAHSRREHAVERDGHVYDAVIYQARTADLVHRADAELDARARGEALERQRFEPTAPSDRLSRR